MGGLPSYEFAQALDEHLRGLILQRQMIVAVEADECGARAAARKVATCGPDGVAALYRNGGRRCREQVIADAERQLETRLAAHLLARSEP